LEVAGWLAKELAHAGITVVSGLARGIDAAAHWGALSAGGVTIGVLGCGLDVCYPRRNKDLYQSIARTGALVSEYPPGTPPLKQNFPVRNRIIAGMCLGVVIVEARPRGGALITARLAMEFSREVFAVPGLVHSPGASGTHALIRDGARLVTSASEIMDDLGMLAMTPTSAPPVLDPDESRVISCLEASPILLDSIAKRARMPVATVTAVLMRLEIKGAVSRHTGGRFALSVAV